MLCYAMQFPIDSPPRDKKNPACHEESNPLNIQVGPAPINYLLDLTACVASDN
jgi:hypothetical protein